MSGKIKEALTEYWGPQCSDFDPDCFCCQAWAELDELTTASRMLAEWRDGKYVTWYRAAQPLPEPPASANMPG